ncbi:MAG: inorganic diphosphatase [Acidobacteria bacterium]|nr:inorganic diphosphatase [Acidobacteriota bacterium]
MILDSFPPLVLMDEPGCTGCLVECRVIGGICGEQTNGGKKIRNDRLVGVAVPSHTHSDLMDITDLNGTLLHEIENFFVNYHQQYGKSFKVLNRCGPDEAMKLVKKAVKRKNIA